MCLLIGISIGLLIGGPIGVLAAALMVVSSKSDAHAERIIGEHNE